MASLREETHVGPYVIQRLLPEGRGGFAQVVVARRASEHGLHEWAALKIAKTRGLAGNNVSAADLAAIYEEALINEADTLWRLRHPGIVSIYPIPVDPTHTYHRMRAMEVDGQPWYFAMEYLPGDSLEQQIEQRGQLDLPLAVEIAQQVGAALDYVHARGFAHLDVKPSNILFRQSVDDHVVPEAVLVDFGTAQKFLRQTDVEGLTLAYSSPERVRIQRGELQPEAFVNKSAADVYSLGVVLYRMLTGRLPFSGSRSHLTTAILTATPTDAQTYAPELKHAPGLNKLLMAMLEKQPNARPKIDDVLERLEGAMPSPRFSGASSTSPPPDSGKRKGRGWQGVAVAFFAVAALEAGGLFYLLNSGELTSSIVPSAPTLTLQPQTTAPISGTALPPTAAPKVIVPAQPQAPATRTISPTAPATAPAEPTITPVPSFTPGA